MSEIKHIVWADDKAEAQDRGTKARALCGFSLTPRDPDATQPVCKKCDAIRIKRHPETSFSSGPGRTQWHLKSLGLYTYSIRPEGGW